jgi:hypothetical protein
MRSGGTDAGHQRQRDEKGLLFFSVFDTFPWYC